MRFTLLFSALIVVSISGCVSIFNPKVISEVSISERRNSSQPCSISHYTPTQVEMFFVKANKVSLQNLHEKTDYEHCAIKGKGLQKKRMCSWEIRAEGTGSIRCGNSIQNYICLDCLKPQI